MYIEQEYALFYAIEQNDVNMHTCVMGSLEGQRPLKKESKMRDEKNNK